MIGDNWTFGLARWGMPLARSGQGPGCCWTCCSAPGSPAPPSGSHNGSCPALNICSAAIEKPWLTLFVKNMKLCTDNKLLLGRDYSKLLNVFWTMDINIYTNIISLGLVIIKYTSLFCFLIINKYILQPTLKRNNRINKNYKAFYYHNLWYHFYIWIILLKH